MPNSAAIPLWSARSRESTFFFRRLRQQEYRKMKASSLGHLSTNVPSAPPRTVLNVAPAPSSCSLSDLNAAEQVVMEALIPHVRVSRWSLFSPYSILSVGSTLSTLGLGAFLSALSCGSALSGASVGSVLSFWSVGSFMSIGCVGGFMEVCW